MNVLNEASRLIRNHKYETTEDGRLVFQRGGFSLGGLFVGRYAPPDEEFGPPAVAFNRVVTQGLVKVLALLGGHASSAALYLAPFSGNVAPDAGWTGASFATDATEFTGYTSATRLPWTTVNPTTPNLTNAAALAAATMTFSAGGPYTIRGAGLIESSVKGGATGNLIVAARFDNDLTGMTAGGKLALEYGIVALDESDV